jgi:hypothetical protein
MQTTGDPNVVPESDQAYASAVRQAGDAALLRETFVHRAGHCAFTPAETIAAVQVLMRRLDSHRWDTAALGPAAMNAAAAALGPAYNVYFTSSNKIVPVRPAFLRYRPAPFLRPYNLAVRQSTPRPDPPARLAAGRAARGVPAAWVFRAERELAHGQDDRNDDRAEAGHGDGATGELGAS